MTSNRTPYLLALIALISLVAMGGNSSSIKPSTEVGGTGICHVTHYIPRLSSAGIDPSIVFNPLSTSYLVSVAIIFGGLLALMLVLTILWYVSVVMVVAEIAVRLWPSFALGASFLLLTAMVGFLWLLPWVFGAGNVSLDCGVLNGVLWSLLLLMMASIPLS